jgi:hypothetical protein
LENILEEGWRKATPWKLLIQLCLGIMRSCSLTKVLIV